MTYSYNGTPLNHEKERTTDADNTMEESHKYDEDRHKNTHLIIPKPIYADTSQKSGHPTVGMGGGGGIDWEGV